MVAKDKAFLERLQKTFKVEADEHLKSITDGILALESKPTAAEQQEIVEIIFRDAHSLKGASRAVNSHDVETICQALESVFALVKNNSLKLSIGSFDTLHSALDTLTKLIGDPSAKGPVRVSQLVRELEGLKSNGPGPVHEPEPVQPPVNQEDDGSSREWAASFETIRVPTGKLDSLLTQTEEMITAKLMIQHDVAGLHGVRDMSVSLLKEWEKISPEIRKIRLLSKNAGQNNVVNGSAVKPDRLAKFYDRTYDVLKTMDVRLQNLAADADQHRWQLSHMIDTLVQDTRNVLMFPFAAVLEIFPKMVRDLSRDQGKAATLVLKGEGIKIDRRILELLKDPLIHLVRNCVDHGLEKPEIREKQGKNGQGTITITVSQTDSQRVEILVADDGCGINPQQIRAAAIKKNILPRTSTLNDDKIIQYIFRSGVSTAPIISDISGRGLGLAIVHEKVERLSGYVNVETAVGSGTRIRMVVPVTFSTFSGVLVRVGDQLFIIPTMNMEMVLKVTKEEIKTVENRETIALGGHAVSLVRLGDILGMAHQERKEEGTEHFHAAVVNAGGKSIAFLVDDVLYEQEILLKGLGRQLSRVRNYAGSTMLGSGKLIPILNVRDLIKSVTFVTTGAMSPVAGLEEKVVKKKTALVVEDSITSRMMLKNILESAGYDVRVAVDGIDGFTILNIEDIDVVISDIEMPRMNGFELVSKIRNTKKFAELPVVLVTALESREDRERGIEIGADAYIVKSSFDQSNLISVIERLI